MANIEHPTELFEAYTLELLTPELAAQVRAHVMTCPDCQERLQATEVALSLLAYAAPPANPPADAEARLMARIQALQAAEQAQPQPTIPQMRPIPRSGWPRLRVAAAAIMAAAIIFLVLTHAFAPPGVGPSALTQADRQARALLGASQPLVYHLAATSAGSPGTVAAMAMDPHAGQGVLVVRNLPALANGRVYEFWIVHIPMNMPLTTTATGILSDSGSVGTLRFTVPPDLGTLQNAGITIEPAGGVTQPDAPMLLYLQSQPV